MARSIIGIGETVLDIVFREGQPQAAVPGGSVFNSMVSLGRTLGRTNPEVRLIMLSQTGDDAVAEIMTSFMAKNGLSTEGIQQVHGQSAVSMAMLDANNNAQYEFFRDKTGYPAVRDVMSDTWAGVDGEALRAPEGRTRGRYSRWRPPAARCATG